MFCSGCQVLSRPWPSITVLGRVRTGGWWPWTSQEKYMKELGKSQLEMNSKCFQVLEWHGRKNRLILHCCRNQSLERGLENIRGLRFSVRKQFLIIIVDYKHILLKLMSIHTKPVVAARSVTKGIPSLSTDQLWVSLRCNKFVIIIEFVIFHSGEIFTCWILDMACRWVQLPCTARIWFKHLLFKHCLLLIRNQWLLIYRLSVFLWVIW